MTDFLSIAADHWARYPKMEPQDFGKLAYQSEFGPAHLVRSPDRVLAALLAEREETQSPPQPPEPIGGGLCRFHITTGLSPLGALPLLGRLFRSTLYRSGDGSEAGLLQKLDQLRALHIPGLEEWILAYRQQGCPPVRHSEAYRNAYHPHYRLLLWDYACYFPALLELEALSRLGRPAIAAVDGRCGSGKSGFAALAQQVIPCQVVHMDDFYLPPDQRAPDWRSIPGGNMDFARLQTEVLLPAWAGQLQQYRPFDCQTGQLQAPLELDGSALTIVEGSYSQHPSLRNFYDRTIFLTCNPAAQRQRLQARNSEAYPRFLSTWIPLEEQYFAQCEIPARSGLLLDTSAFF